jgi:AcrR family transcriptional regulator
MRSATLRSRKLADARRALFEAAMELFRERGFDETTADDIAARAGFSRATFFNHFGSKAAVLRYFGEHVSGVMEATLAGAPRGTPPLERLRRVLLAMAREVEGSREEWRIVFTCSLREPDGLAAPTPARRRLVETVAEIVSEAQAVGQARTDLGAAEQAAQVVALYKFAVMSVALEGRSAKAAIAAAWRFAEGGIRGDPGARRGRSRRRARAETTAG